MSFNSKNDYGNDTSRFKSSNINVVDTQQKPIEPRQSEDFVDSLEKQYKLTNEESLIRLKRSENNQKSLIENLSNQINHTKSQIEQNKSEYESELFLIKERQHRELNDLMNSKDSTIRNLEEKQVEMKQTYETELDRLSKAKEDNHQLKFNSSNDLAELQMVLRNKEDELEELKHQHFVNTQERMTSLMVEKSELKESFETAIKRLKNAHDQDVLERKDQIAIQKNMTYDLLEEIRGLRLKAEEQVEQIVNEIKGLKEAVQSGKKLNEMQYEDNSRLKEDLGHLKTENQMLCREISMLENDSSKLRGENDGLRNNIIKLDKIVQGITTNRK